VTESTVTSSTLSPGTNTDLTGQTFTVPLVPVTDNFLHTLRFTGFVASSAGPYTVKVTAVDGSGFPTGAPLFQSALLAPPIDGPTFYPNITLTPGVQYAVYTESPISFSGFKGGAADPYPGGTAVSHNNISNLWSAVTGFDVAFRAEFSDGKGATLTTVACPASGKIGQSATCTATVTNGGTGFGTPTGQVGFNSIGGGTFTGTCNLNGAGQCNIGYTPDPGSSAHTIFGQYAGDGTHVASAGSDTFTATKRVTAQSATTCVPATLVVGQSATCSTTVTDTDAGTLTTPTGITTWNHTGAGSFSPSVNCGLTPVVLGTAKCTAITYTPAAAGSHAITSTYVGDGSHLATGAAAAGTLTVSEAPVTAPPDCTDLRSKLKRLKGKLRKADSKSEKSKLRKKIKKTRRELAARGC